MYAKVIVLAFVLGLTSAAVYRDENPSKPEGFANKEGCYVEEINDVIGFGDTVSPPGHCYQVECHKDSITYSSCGMVGTDDPDCHVTKGDSSKLYPECCPTIACEKGDNSL